jgi:hypothetical protein
MALPQRGTYIRGSNPDSRHRPMSSIVRWRGAVLLAVTLLAACANEPTSEADRLIVVGRITLPADSFTVRTGMIVLLEATAVDQRGALLTRLPDGEHFEWTSSNPAVATVIDGAVTGRQPGRSIITVRAGGQLAAARVGVINGQ